MRGNGARPRLSRAQRREATPTPRPVPARAAPGPSAQSAPRPTADVARTPPAANAEAAVAVTRRPAGDLSAEATEPVMSSTPSAPAVRAPSARAAGASRPAEDTAEVIAVEVPRKSALPFVLIGLILVVATIAVVVFRD